MVSTWSKVCVGVWEGQAYYPCQSVQVEHHITSEYQILVKVGISLFFFLRSNHYCWPKSPEPNIVTHLDNPGFSCPGFAVVDVDRVFECKSLSHHFS